MAQGDLIVFNTAKEWLADGTFDLDAGTWKVAILDNTVTPVVAGATPQLGDFTEVGAAGSYTAGGNAITPTWVESSGTVTFDASDPATWTQNASNDIDAWWALVYGVGTLNTIVDPALCFIELAGPVDMSAGDLTVAFNASGLFTLA